MPSSNDIRSAFLDYFARHDHQVVPSSPLVPRNDPTLLFTNAGMVQFKNVFTGRETLDYARAASSQKCVRAGGKHNDLENVGHTARHHTFFEMLGNFSFGDYFKERAIELAWDLVSREFAIDPGRLLVTVYAEDDAAFDLWKKIAGLPESRIVRIATSDNFWAMGDTGPCGPSSEIFYDHGPDIPGGPPGSPDEAGDRFIEIWNLVFMQYDQIRPDERVDLPHPSIDTGMGLERIAAVLQGVHDNYDTDLFKALISASVEVSGVRSEGDRTVSHRVIADHLRASCFLIADGVLPANDGRGYVLRRIMRRAMRHAHLLGCKEPLIWRLVPALIGEMGRAFPELGRAEALMTETLRLEEERFKDMLARGLRLLDDEEAKIPAGGALPGDVAFRLYDTYGFPLDLTQDILRGQGKTVELSGFEAAMARQRAEARAAWQGSGEAVEEDVWLDLADRLGVSEFLGYEAEEADGQVVAMVRDGTLVDSLAEGQEGAIVLNQTPFYAESGGQLGDHGILTRGDALFSVSDTRKHGGGLHVHLGVMSRGNISAGDTVRAAIESARRDKLRAAHSATHLLHEALRRVVGGHVTQKGSLVAPDRLRFDISHAKPLTAEQMAEVEQTVNARIRKNADVTTRYMTPDEAVSAGALALFGEKYGDEVRVVSMGGDARDKFSTELCGGTHVGRTGDIGLFKIVGESAVSAGVRRIEALTGEAAERHVAEEESQLRAAASALKVRPQELGSRVGALVEERRKLERELSDARRALALGGTAGAGQAAAGGEPGETVRKVGDITFAPRIVRDMAPKDLKGLADDLKKKIGSGVVAVAAANDGKASLVVGVTDDLTARISAVDLVRAGAEALGGKGGGGRPDMAQAGGPGGDRLEAAVSAIEGALAKA